MQANCTPNQSAGHLKRITALVLFFFLAGNVIAQPYCTVSSDCSSGDVITNVTFGTLNNNSGCGINGYTNNIIDPNIAVPAFARGYLYVLSVTIGSGTSDRNVGVWIDGNHDNVFSDNEFTFVGTTTGGILTKYVFVSNAALSGLTGMRVRTTSSGQIAAADACTNFALGETEDYSINLTDCPIDIVGQPEDQTICAGSNVSFYVDIVNTYYLTYQWQVSHDGGATYINVTDDVVYSGSNLAALSLTNVPLSYSGYKYKLLLTMPPCSSSGISAPATLTVVPGNIAITTQPVGGTSCQGIDFTFTVAATGPVTGYQWQVSPFTYIGSGFTDIPGATAASYTIINGNPAQFQNGYRCIVLSNDCPVISDKATLTINYAPLITQPQDVSACVGGTALFSIYTGGGSGQISLQWQVSTGGGPFTDLPGETNYSLSVPVTAAVNGNQYHIIVSNPGCGTIISNAATLTVASSPGITQQPASVTVCAGDYTHFVIISGGVGNTYQWQVSTDGTNFTDMPGQTQDTLSISPATLPLNGNQYQVIITGVGCTGTTTSVPATLTVNQPVDITQQPVNTSACVGDVVTFSTVVTGIDLSYQWQVSAGGPYTNIVGATSASYTTPPVTAAMNGNYYRVFVSSSLCPNTVSSTAVLLTVNTDPVITTQPVSGTTCAGGSNTFSVVLTGTVLGYQWEMSTVSCAGPWVAIAGATTSNITISNGTVTSYYHCQIFSPCGGGFIYSDCATLTVNGSIDITAQPADQTICAGADAVFSVATSSTGVNYQWQVNTGTSFVDLPGETNSTLTIPAVTVALNGNQYQVILTGTGCPNVITSADATLTVNQSPQILGYPVHLDACQGELVTFSTVATGTNLSYQWQVSTDYGASYTLIPGATNSSYVAGPLTGSMNWNVYQVIVTGDCVSPVISQPDTLTVEAPATITTQPTDVAVCPGGIAFFNIYVFGTATLQWQVSTTGCTGTFVDLPGQNYPTLYFNPVNVSQDNLAYRCVVTSTCTGTTIISNCAILTISSIDIITQPADVDACSGSNATFLVTTNNPALFFQWQVATGIGPFTDIPFAYYNTLTIPAVSAALNGNRYRVSITSGTCTNVMSDSATLSVFDLPQVTITANPANTSLLPGQSTVLTTTVAPVATYTFSWQKDGIDIGGANTDSYTVHSGEAGAYSVIATSAANCASPSNIINVTDSVSARFAIYSNPNNGRFTIAYPNLPAQSAVNIFNSHGQRVFLKDNIAANQLIRVDIGSAPSGVYIIVVKNAGGVQLATEKVIVVH